MTVTTSNGVSPAVTDPDRDRILQRVRTADRYLESARRSSRISQAFWKDRIAKCEEDLAAARSRLREFDEEQARPNTIVPRLYIGGPVHGQVLNIKAKARQDRTTTGETYLWTRYTDFATGKVHGFLALDTLSPQEIAIHAEYLIAAYRSRNPSVDYDL